jgi:hypothetical protein
MLIPVLVRWCYILLGAWHITTAISFKTDTEQLLPCFPKFALTRQKGVSSFDFSPELLVVHNRSEW